MVKKKWSEENRKEILDDFRIALRSRNCSLLGRKEVLTGKASFGIFGDGVELPQIALAKAFQKGDFRAGYYRDQTIEFALGNLTVVEFFSQLYANTNIEQEPNSGGRQMNCHFASRLLQDDGSYKDQRKTYNTSADISPTAGQMNRLLGLAYASKLYRNSHELKHTLFSHNGNEVAFGSIGDASTSEGYFFEVVNAAGVLQVPLVISVWDNGYGISVPRHLQTVNHSISKALSGFSSQNPNLGITIMEVQGWSYEDLCNTYQKAADTARTQHKPVLIHVQNLTQPQGHSTSGSHERYKTKERLNWEKDHCCIKKMRSWILEEGIASVNLLETLENEERIYVQEQQKIAWDLYQKPLEEEKKLALQKMDSLYALPNVNKNKIKSIENLLLDSPSLYRRNIQSALFQSILATAQYKGQKIYEDVLLYYKDYDNKYRNIYRSKLYSEFTSSPLNVPEVKPIYEKNEPSVDGRMVLLKCFDFHLSNNPAFFALGEDIGKLGGVNLVFEGLNAKYGDLRVSDTGIREASILGQGLGAALRGLRPLVDIQYLDYLLYALQGASDDLATLLYRSAGGQKAPVIIRTKGHRLEGIWHTGSPMATLLGALRGMYICVPRNMTQAAGMYNTLLAGDQPALVIEVLSGYRQKEVIPTNVGTFTVPLGVPEILKEGSHLTIVTYGFCCRTALEAWEILQNMNIFVEVVDVQTLIPFDRFGVIENSIKKTNAVLFFDEDVPGGATAYMLQQTLERERLYHYLDAGPRTLSAAENRGAYGRDGDYYCKPQVEDVVQVCYQIMHERDPKTFPQIF